jgi:hypothetical protein
VLEKILMVLIRNRKFPRAILTPWKETMRNFTTFVAVILMTSFVVAGSWTCLLGAQGMQVFWTSMLCSATLAIHTRGSILSNPWAIVVGLVLAGLLLGVPAKLVPATSSGYGYLSQATGLTLSEAARIQNFAFYGTVFVFLVLGLIEAFKPKSRDTTQHLGAPEADNS